MEVLAKEWRPGQAKRKANRLSAILLMARGAPLRGAAPILGRSLCLGSLLLSEIDKQLQDSSKNQFCIFFSKKILND